MTLKFTAMSLATVAILAGCSSPSVVNTRDGSQIVTPDKPDYDKKSGMYQYDQNGKEVQINKDDVKSIEQVK
ncbi:YgdI/YgdR family lipoprotein [Bordetella genomosp. 11]|uniref:YgdI/YgdR family lipoprotein n=1 Tax=Bordetella genomosp. 11 TaxID=1416808 RepID=A0A261UHC8_9BORD|nr:YgdI/YgdR family lipoprotein [Bordetella genomosp. 11]OZI61349.1 YgdI/YgdR family lipoprotein [Bordetella genomosp. 11]